MNVNLNSFFGGLFVFLFSSLFFGDPRSLCFWSFIYRCCVQHRTANLIPQRFFMLSPPPSFVFKLMFSFRIFPLGVFFFPIFCLWFAELMLLGFISLLLTVGQGPISNICISEKVGATWHPCSKSQESDHESNGRKLLGLSDSPGGGRRVLAGAAYDNCAAKVIRSIILHHSILCIHLFYSKQ